VVFIALALSNGDRYLHTQAGLSIAVDSLMVIVFVAYLGTGTRAHGTHP
jgi:hypothetical protein